MWATMLRRIPSLFLHDAWIYSEDAVLWYVVLCIALFCNNVMWQQFTPVSSTWPYLRCGVGLEEGEY